MAKSRDYNLYKIWTDKDAVQAARQDAADRALNPDDPNQEVPFFTKIIAVMAEMHGRLAMEYSKDIQQLDDEYNRVAGWLAQHSDPAKVAWENQFESRIKSAFWYWGSLFAVALADVGMNAFVFGAWMDNQATATYMAVFVAVALMLTAKVSAGVVRSGKTVAVRVAGAAVMLLPVALLWFLSVNRAELMGAEGEASNLPVFFALNLLGLAVGFLLSFLYETPREKHEDQLAGLKEKRESVHDKHCARSIEIRAGFRSIAASYLEEAPRAWKTPVKWKIPAVPVPAALFRPVHDPKHEGGLDLNTQVMVDVNGREVDDRTGLPLLSPPAISSERTASSAMPPVETEAPVAVVEPVAAQTPVATESSGAHVDDDIVASAETVEGAAAEDPSPAAVEATASPVDPFHTEAAAEY